MSPSYEYECLRCGNIFQVNRPMSDSSKPAKCGTCRVECKRIVTGGTGFILKGNDWPGKEIRNGNKKPKTT